MNKITEKKIAVLLEEGFDKDELDQSQKALENAGAKTYIVSPQMGRVMSWKKNDWDKNLKVDMNLNHAEPEFYDALLIPGGILHVDKLRNNELAIKFINHFIGNKKPVAVMSHAPWLLIETGNISGKTLTSWPTLKKDLENAGAHWVNKNAVADDGLISCQSDEGYL